MAGAGIEIVALNEKEWRYRLVANLPHLRPEPSTAEGAVEIGDRLALNENPSVDPVIACREWLDRDTRAEFVKHGRDAAPSLEHVDHHIGRRIARFVLSGHLCSLGRQLDGEGTE